MNFFLYKSELFAKLVFNFEIYHPPSNLVTCIIFPACFFGGVASCLSYYLSVKHNFFSPFQSCLDRNWQVRSGGNFTCYMTQLSMSYVIIWNYDAHINNA